MEKIIKMRVVAKSTLRTFWEEYPDAEIALQLWYEAITSKEWETSNDIIQAFSRADTVGNGRIIFNICRNKYRLIVLFRYKIQVCYIRFIGTHKEYDKIESIENI